MTGGTITGSVINGTILRGAVALALSPNQAVANPSVEFWGETSDDRLLCRSLGRAEGVGMKGSQVARIVSSDLVTSKVSSRLLIRMRFSRSCPLVGNTRT